MKSLNTMLVLGLLAVSAAVYVNAQEGCDGPVFVPGYSTGTCNCVNSTSGSGGTGGCQPSGLTIGFRNDYYTCGGSGYSSCSSSSQTVGYVNPGCVDTANLPALISLESAYEDCIRINNGSSPPVICKKPQFCDWNTCAMATSGGTPIIDNVLTGTGDANGCMVAELQKAPAKSVVQVAQMSSKKLGS